jgi:hypothetical protein
MPYTIYKLIHFLGLFAVLTVLAATAMHALGGGTRDSRPFRRTFGVVHGIAAFLILLGGFGMLARLGVVHTGLPVWVYLKLVVWLVVSAALLLPYRGRPLALAVIIGLPLLTFAGAAIALYKPF